MTYLGGGLEDKSSSVKQIYKYNKKLQNGLMFLKNKNKVIFNMKKNTSSHKELCKFKNIKATLYDSYSEIYRNISDAS